MVGRLGSTPFVNESVFERSKTGTLHCITIDIAVLCRNNLLEEKGIET